MVVAAAASCSRARAILPTRQPSRISSSSLMHLREGRIFVGGGGALGLDVDSLWGGKGKVMCGRQGAEWHRRCGMISCACGMQSLACAVAGTFETL
jgi:hypothetical protein